MKNKLLYIFMGLFLVLPLNIFALEKNEVVYTTINKKGDIKEVSVVNHLSSIKGTITDTTDLTNITNLNGDEKLTLNNNKLTLKGIGDDIIYSGKVTKQLPITMNIKYFLDDKELSYKQIKGKEGHIKIEIEYQNNDSHVSNNKTIYTPFFVATTLILDKSNTNIKVSSGKVMTSGSNNMIVGISMPGISKSLNNTSLDKFDTLLIEFDTKKFNYSNLYFVASCNLMDDIDISNTLDSVNNLSSSINLLSDNMDKIDNGASSLKEGTYKYKQGLEEAISTLKNSGSKSLSESDLELIKESVLNNIDDTFTDSYKEEIATNTWNNVRENMDDNDENIAKIIQDSVSNSVNKYLQDTNNIQNYYLCINDLSESDICNSLLEKVNLIKTYTSNASIYSASNTSLYVAEKVSKEVSKEVSYNAAKEVGSNISVMVANKVSEEVKNTSLDTIDKLLSTLYDGIIKINDGASDLSLGITTFNTSGIDVLVSKTNTIKNYSDEINDLKKLADDYKGYGSNNTSSSTFIYKVK